MCVSLNSFISRLFFQWLWLIKCLYLMNVLCVCLFCIYFVKNFLIFTIKHIHIYICFVYFRLSVSVWVTVSEFLSEKTKKRIEAWFFFWIKKVILNYSSFDIFCSFYSYNIFVCLFCIFFSSSDLWFFFFFLNQSVFALNNHYIIKIISYWILLRICSN